MKNILIFGFGYLSYFLFKALSQSGFSVTCTSRSLLSKRKEGVNLVAFNDAISSINNADVILSTVPPDKSKDPVLYKYSKEVSQNDKLLVYFSSTSVYGNHKGCWVNEDSECMPSNERAKARLEVEKSWINLSKNVSILRLAGIYGPENNCLVHLRGGKSEVVFKEDHFFSRIHVEDICNVVLCIMEGRFQGTKIYNISDGNPETIHNVYQFGANILGMSKLRNVPFEEANLSERAREFFLDNKKVDNSRMLNELKVKLRYSSYKEGLLSCFDLKPY